jgi:hypothetical protein
MKGLTLLFALLLLVVAGCGGDSATGSNPFAGTYQGTWVNVDDATDAGTSTWTIHSDGRVTGQDIDPNEDITYNLNGTINWRGDLETTSTPTEGDSASLDGRLMFDQNRKLTGVLTWGVQPPLDYRYTFTRVSN